MKISIITATRNRASVLGTALDSLASQTFSDWEHLVQDGGDDTATTALLEIRPDPRRSIVRAPDQGLYDALNRAILRASGDIVGVLHSDDIFAGTGRSGQFGQCLCRSEHYCRLWRFGVCVLKEATTGSAALEGRQLQSGKIAARMGSTAPNAVFAAQRFGRGRALRQGTGRVSGL